MTFCMEPVWMHRMRSQYQDQQWSPWSEWRIGRANVSALSGGGAEYEERQFFPHPPVSGEPVGQIKRSIEKRIADIVNEYGDYEPDTNYTNLPVWAETVIEELEALLNALPVPAAHPPKATVSDETQASRDVLAERRRQVEAEGWSPGHDDAHRNGTLSLAAAAYAIGATGITTLLTEPGREARKVTHQLWPWGDDWWKPGDRRRNLVKAGALILAEIECIDRAALTAAMEVK